MSRRVLGHTADTGIEASAGSIGALIEELAAGMFELICTPDPADATEDLELRVDALTLDDLVVDTLSELLYESEVEDLVFCDFDVRMDGERGLTIRACGVPLASVEPSGPPIKAVTYHGLQVEDREGDWYGRVYFDV